MPTHTLDAARPGTRHVRHPGPLLRHAPAAPRWSRSTAFGNRARQASARGLAVKPSNRPEDVTGTPTLELCCPAAHHHEACVGALRLLLPTSSSRPVLLRATSNLACVLTIRFWPLDVRYRNVRYLNDPTVSSSWRQLHVPTGLTFNGYATWPPGHRAVALHNGIRAWAYSMFGILL